jgi:hypothetical protein
MRAVCNVLSMVFWNIINKTGHRDFLLTQDFFLLI